MTLFIYEEIVLDHTSIPVNFVDQSEEQQMQDVVDRYYYRQLNKWNLSERYHSPARSAHGG